MSRSTSSVAGVSVITGVRSGVGEVHPRSAAAEYRLTPAAKPEEYSTAPDCTPEEKPLTPAAKPESANAKIGNNKNNMRRTDLI